MELDATGVVPFGRSGGQESLDDPPKSVVATFIALVFGLGPPDPNFTGESFPFPNDWTLLAADETHTEQSQVQSEENADESARMGEDSGPHTVLVKGPLGGDRD